MRLERSFVPHSPEVISSRVPEHIRPSTEFELFVPSTEVVLFYKIDGKKDTEAPDQAPEINQDVELIRTSVNGDWEPFNLDPFNLDPHPSQNFINLYGGPFSQQMELNRKNAERLLQVAAIEGKVILTSLSMSRTRSAEVNPDGTATGKRGLFWGKKPEDAENPYHRVTSIPEGWRVEICDQRIHDELSQKFAGEKLQKKFVAKFNQHFRAGIWQAVWKEKMDVFSRGNYYKVFGSSWPLLLNLFGASQGGFKAIDIPWFFGGSAFMHGIMNISGQLFKLNLRNLTQLYEYLMPLIEVDRVARAFSYLNLKGRNLVRLR